MLFLFRAVVLLLKAAGACGGMHYPGELVHACLGGNFSSLPHSGDFRMLPESLIILSV